MSDTLGEMPITPSQPPSQQTDRHDEEVKEPAKKSPARAPKKRSGLPLPVLVLGGALLLLAGYCLAGFLLLPKLIADRLPARILSETGLQAALQQVQYNPFSSRLQISGVQILEIGRDRQPKPVLKIDELTAILSPLAILRTEYVCSALTIDGLYIEIVRDENGKYNFGRFLDTQAKNKTPDLMNLAELPFRFSLNNISITKGKAVFYDKPGDTTHVAENIELALPNLSNTKYQVRSIIQPRFSAILNGSPVELTETPSAADKNDKSKGNKTELSCALRDIDLPKYLHYLPVQLPLGIIEGRADGTLLLTFSQKADHAKFDVDFALKTSGLVLEDAEKLIKVTMPSAFIDGTFQPMTGDTTLKNIMAHDFAIAAKEAPWNLATVVAGTRSTDTAKTPSQEKAATIAIENLLLEGGNYTLVESKNSKPTKWEKVDIKVSQFVRRPNAENTDEASGAYSIQASQSDEKAIVRLDGAFTNGAVQSGKVRFEKVPCSRLFGWFGVGKLASAKGIAEFEGTFAPNENAANGPVSYKVSNGSLVIKDFRLADASERDWLTVPEARFSEFGSDGKKTTLGKVNLQGSKISIETGNLPAIFSTLHKNQHNVSLKSLEINGELTLKKQSAPDVKTVFSDVKILANDLDTAKKLDDRDNFTFTAKVGAEGQVQARGFITLQPLGVTLRTGFEQLQASMFVGWINPGRALQAIQGKIDGRGLFNLPRFAFNGDIQVHAGGLQIPGSKDRSMSWESMELQGINHAFITGQTVISDVVIKKPLLAVQMTEKSPGVRTQLAGFMKDLFPQEKKTPGQSASGGTPTVEIQKISLDKGSIDYTDARVKPGLKLDFTEISGTATDFYSSTGSKAGSFSLKGNLNGAPFTYAGKVSFADASLPGESKFSVSNFALSHLQKQLAGKVDLDPEQGTAGCELATKWQNNSIEDNAKVLLRDVEAANHAAPTSLTLALLDNGQRQYEFAVGLNRTPDKPALSLVTETIAGFQKVVSKSGNAPLQVASGNFADLAGKEYVEFIPGRAVLSENGKTHLARFVEFLKKHPSVSITLNGSADSHVDRDGLKKELEREEQIRVDKENARRHAKLVQDSAKASEKRGDHGPKGGASDAAGTPEQLKVQPVTIDTAALKALAEERAKMLFTSMKTHQDLYHGQLIVSPAVRITKEKNDPGNRVNITIGQAVSAGKEQHGKQ